MTRSLLHVVIALALLGATPAPGEEIAVIVNAERAGDFDREEIAQIYLKKRRFWSDGSAILPVNHSAGAAARIDFEEAVFGGGTRRLPVYWNRAYFRGVLPPLTLASDEAVRRFVTSEPRAIGYVRAAALDGSVRVVLRLRNADHD